MTRRSHTRRRQINSRPPSLTEALEKCHFERLGDRMNRGKIPDLPMMMEILRLHRDHGPGMISVVRDMHRDRWCVVADQNGIIWLTERHCVPDRYCAGLIQVFDLKPIDNDR